MTANKPGNLKDNTKPNIPFYPVVITREPGKCWYCADKWVPGHSCKQSKVLNIMVMDPKEKEEGELNLTLEVEKKEEQEDEEQAPVEEELLQISLQALKGCPTVATFSVIITLKGRTGVSLVDSGSSHTFVDLKFVTKAQCIAQNNDLQKVTVAGGGVLYTGAHLAECEY